MSSNLQKSIVVLGANGMIGTPLCSRLTDHDVTALARNVDKARERLDPRVRILVFPGREADQAIEAADIVVNLAGASVAGKRWTPDYKVELAGSRLGPTRHLVSLLQPGQTLLNASAVGYYGDCKDSVVTEKTPSAPDFLGRLCWDWEQAALRAEQNGVRVVLLRTGIVLHPDGGALEQMLRPFRLGVGGPLGSGRQWMPWIHLDDEVEMIAWAALQPEVCGPINLVSPNPATMAEFARTLAGVLHRPGLVPAPGFALRLLLGEFAESLLVGQRAVPEAALRHGYGFRFPELRGALEDLLGS